MKDYKIFDGELTQNDLNLYARQGYELHTYIVNSRTSPQGFGIQNYKIVLVKNVPHNN